MHEPTLLTLPALVVGASGADVLGAELEGALQYPPLSVGEDVQTTAAGEDAAAASFAMADRTWRQRVERATEYAAILSPFPAPLG